MGHAVQGRIKVMHIHLWDQDPPPSWLCCVNTVLIVELWGVVMTAFFLFNLSKRVWTLFNTLREGLCFCISPHNFSFLDIQGGNMKTLFYYSWLPTNIVHDLKRVLIKQTLMRLYFSFYGTECLCLCLLTVQCWPKTLRQSRAHFSKSIKPL